MPLSIETSFDILGLPTFASEDEIIRRYKVLAVRWYPAVFKGCKIAISEFRNISEATVKLLYPKRNTGRPMLMLEMYAMFQYIFFGDKFSPEEIFEDDEKECEDKKVGPEDLQAEIMASNLISEEEKEKIKAEKKKAKRKKWKERKKQQKEKDAGVAKQNEEDDTSSVDQTQGAKEDKFSDAEEEDLDTSSAFVAVIAKKQKQIPICESKTKSVPSQTSFEPSVKLVEDPTSVVLRSRRVALRGNEMASLGHYVEAVDLFTEAIKLDSSDHRFYGNRSYCYDRLGQFERALKDAEKSIALCPTWPKGHFRKGRALLGLKKYALAEGCFSEVLKYDQECEDAISELRKARILQIMGKGYSKEQAENALSQYDTVAEALQGLIAGGVTHLRVTEEIEVFFSDDESDVMFKSISKPKYTSAYDVKTDPRNPEGHNSLWIGNLTAEATEKRLTTLFSKYGDVTSIKVMPEKYCAFVNYRNKTAPGRAMLACQGMDFYGCKLVIRFPNLPGEPAPSKKKVGASQGHTNNRLGATSKRK